MNKCFPPWVQFRPKHTSALVGNVARRAPGHLGELEGQGIGLEGERAGLFTWRDLPLLVSSLYTFFELIGLM